jgi:UDP-N-acetylmuramoyl-L-alanyl-D-glutamate--2,6-diaminopimelate ligase
MTLRALFEVANVMPLRLEGDADISGVKLDSRKVTAGDLFVCQAGTVRDSHEFLDAAKAAGAVAALAHSPEGFARARGLGLAAALLPSGKLAFNHAVWQLCDAFFEHPTRGMKVVGVTGTNGKTTTAWLVRDLLAALGESAGYLGTLGFQTPSAHWELANTTPYAVELYGLLAEARAVRLGALAMEVSSHALAERRADGVEIDVAAYTNLTQDHLDFHGTMEAYEAAKLRLFTDLPSQSAKAFTGVYNAADPACLRAASAGKGRKVGFGAIDPGGFDGFLQGRARHIGVDRIELELAWADRQACAVVPIGGAFNVENSLAAAASVLSLGYGVEEVAGALAKVRPVPGRFEPVRNDQGISVIVDYAHTPDALEKLLAAVRPLAKGRVICVFGCGGDRDRAKRPLMAAAVTKASDLTVLTSDNPRTEDPAAILADIRAGVVAGAEVIEIIDRPEAIAYAIRAARPEDVVVLAGKGHENYQIIGCQKHPMDDRELAREALAAR